jgi:PEP-CTERM motif
MKLRFAGMIVGAVVLSSTWAQADLVTNGGFETGDFSGWTLTNDTNSFVFTSDPGTTYVPHSGNYEALLGAYGSDGTLSQTISDIAGQMLVLTYWLASDGNTPNDFSALWNGRVITGSALTNIGLSGYTEYSFDVLATGSDELAFNERNDYGFLSLDDVSLNALPEPGTLSLLGLGLVAMGVRRRKRG